MPHYFVGEMPRQLFRAAIPETNLPFLIDDVDPDRQVFHQMPEQVRTVEKVMEHDGSLPSGSIGSEGRELQTHRCKARPRHAS